MLSQRKTGTLAELVLRLHDMRRALAQRQRHAAWGVANRCAAHRFYGFLCGANTGRVLTGESGALRMPAALYAFMGGAGV